jgi:1,4-dihydroxy-2-naphthoate octaprenyltransferase
MKTIKLMLSAFILMFALLGVARVISFDVVLPVVVVCTAFISYTDARKMMRENRPNEARPVMNAVVFMLALAGIWIFSRYF